MAWTVALAEEFEPEFDDLSPDVQDAILARALLLQREGPSLGRPHADTLTGSKHANMKEPAATPLTACGASPSLSIPTGGQFCSSAATSRVVARSASTRDCSPWPTNGSTAISRDGKDDADGA